MTTAETKQTVLELLQDLEPDEIITLLSITRDFKHDNASFSAFSNEFGWSQENAQNVAVVMQHHVC